MKVYLAGFNVDTTILKELEAKTGKREDLTPEVISAAYARISRDSRPINIIRELARSEVEKSRKSNSTIIFKMGHHSVAEHAVFNLDILGISRYCMEELEKFRLCSYTEKSQRYITLDKDFVIPEEIKGTPLEKKFIAMIETQNQAYVNLFKNLKTHIFKKYADLAANPKNHNLLEGWAKEDARYITALATESQVGQTINARNLELVLRRFASHPLKEVKQLGRTIYDQIAAVAPSILIFHQANDFDQHTFGQLKDVAAKIIAENAKTTDMAVNSDVSLVELTKDADLIVLSSLLCVATDKPYTECKNIIKALNDIDKKEILKTVWQNMQFYDTMPREFEYINLTYNIVLSSACFGQLKRHRMSTITAQSYDPNLGNTIPEAIKEIKMQEYFMEIVDKTNKVYDEINRQIPLAASYILTNSHRKRVLIRVNGRELYHISRLREDTHAQWDIQDISRKMTKLAKENVPFIFDLIGGKDKYNEIYAGIYGKLPKVTEALLPGVKKINV
ncbi:MAG: FAD-dependent thymidylate synthase [Candidatus Omnitrophota bacterium]